MSLTLYLICYMGFRVRDKFPEFVDDDKTPQSRSLPHLLKKNTSDNNDKDGNSSKNKRRGSGNNQPDGEEEEDGIPMSNVYF